MLRQWMSRVIRAKEPVDLPEQRPVGEMGAFLDDLVQRGFRPRHILDVGANYANWSWQARARFPEARFTLVEPQAELETHLADFCRAHPGARSFCVGAGPDNEDRELTVWPDLAGSSFVPTPEEAQEYGKHRRSVPMRTLDSIASEVGAPVPDLVKLDIQGFELEALRGAGSFFGKTELFILEVSFFPFSKQQPTIAEVVEFMAGRGYEPYEFCGFLRRPYDGALGQADVAFARQAGTLRASMRWQ